VACSSMHDDATTTVGQTFRGECASTLVARTHLSHPNGGGDPWGQAHFAMRVGRDPHAVRGRETRSVR